MTEGWGSETASPHQRCLGQQCLLLQRWTGYHMRKWQCRECGCRSPPRHAGLDVHLHLKLGVVRGERSREELHLPRHIVLLVEGLTNDLLTGPPLVHRLYHHYARQVALILPVHQQCNALQHHTWLHRQLDPVLTGLTIGLPVGLVHPIN